MSNEREIKTETNWLGEEKQIIYEDGRKVGEICSEDRGGFFGIGSERVDVEYTNDGSEVSYTKSEDRGGVLGIGAEETRVTYDSNTDQEIEASRVEERGGIFGIGSHHVRVGRDTEGNEISQTNHENRGGFLGIGTERVRVKRNTSSKKARRAKTDTKNDTVSSYSTSTPSDTGTVSSGQSRPLSGVKASVASFIIGILIAVATLFTGQVLMVVGSYLTGLPHAADGFLEILLFIPVGIFGVFVWLVGYLMSIPLFLIEHLTGFCLAFGPGTVLSSNFEVGVISFCK